MKSTGRQIFFFELKCAILPAPFVWTGTFFGGRIFFWHGMKTSHSVDAKEVPVYEHSRLWRRGRC